jgi:hypothetical protein
MTDTARDRLRMHLTQAATRTDDADVRAHLIAALGALDELPFVRQADRGSVIGHARSIWPFVYQAIYAATRDPVARE